MEENKQKIADDATATIGKDGLTITHGTHELLIQWENVEVNKQDLIRAAEYTPDRIQRIP